MEADDRHVTTVFTVQPSFHHRHSTNRVSWSVTIGGQRRGEVWLHVCRSGDASWCWVGLWRLSSLDGRRPPWYRPLIMGSTTWSNPGFAVLQPSCSLGNQEKGKSFILLGASFTRTALVKTAMTSPLLCFLPSVMMFQHCLRCVARIARTFSRSCVFSRVVFCVLHVLFCVFHVLFCMFHAFFCMFHVLFCVLHALFHSKSPNAVGWRQWLTGSVVVSVAKRRGDSQDRVTGA